MRSTGARTPPAEPFDMHTLGGLVAAALMVVVSGGALVVLADWSHFRLSAGFLAFVLLGWIVARRAGWLSGSVEPGPANLATLLRAGLGCLIGGSLLGGAPEIGWSLSVMIAVALALDAIDGWLARRLGTVSAFGARFDMEVDALLLIVLSLWCWQADRVGAWVLAIGLMRYAFVLAGRWWPPLREPLPERRRRKAICALQGVALGLVLTPPVGPPLAGVMAATALAALATSFALDVAWLVAAHRRRHRIVRLIGASPAPYSAAAVASPRNEERR